MPAAELNLEVRTQQARRLKRFWVAAASSLLVLLFMFLLYREQHLAGTGFIYTAAGILSCIVFYYAMFRSGLNLKARDPSLTFAQVASAIIVLTISAYYTSSDARGVILPIILMAFVFGVFDLDTRKLLSIAAIAIVGYGLMVGLLQHFRPHDIDLRLELLRIAVFGPILLWFAVMGGHIGKLRRALRDTKVALEELAVRDALTGVHNRRYLENMLRREKNRSDRSGDVFCIGMLDLDHFKSINDTFGHQMGDEVLKAVATRGVEAVRPTDSFGRYGGEEFEILLAQTRIQGAATVAERVRSAVEKLNFQHTDQKFGVTVSIGLSQYRRGESVEETEKRADAALYRAKAAGRNRVEIEAEGN